MNIQGAIAAGYTAKQILNYLASAFPELGHRIKEAVGAGKNAEDILKYLSNFDSSKLSKIKGRTNVEKPFQNTSQVNPLLEGQAATKAYDPIPQGLKSAAKLGATALAGTAASPLINKGIQAAGPLVGNLLGQVFGQEQQQPSPAPEATAEGGIMQPSIPAPEATAQLPVQQEFPSINSEAVLNQFGVKDRVDTMLMAKNSPEQISAGIRATLKGKIKPKELEQINQAIVDYAQKSQVKPEIQPAKTMPVQEEVEKPISKGSEVLTQDGVGKVISISGNNALIEEDGKKKQVKLDQVVQAPLPEKELADLYKDLIGGIEKKTGQDVSRMVSFAGYDPDNNELVFKPHDGGVYVYKDIDPEEVELLTNFLTQRKTTGSNYIGSWTAGTGSPIGAAMSALIKKLQSQSGGKGKEYIRKYQTIYDYLEPARKETKERLDEERKRKKKKPSR